MILERLNSYFCRMLIFLRDYHDSLVSSTYVSKVNSCYFRIDQAAEGGSLAGTTNVEKITTNIRNKLIQGVTPIIKAQRAPPDNIDEFKADYGSIGAYLYQSVVRSRGAAVAQGTGLNPKVIQQQQHPCTSEYQKLIHRSSKPSHSF